MTMTSRETMDLMAMSQRQLQRIPSKISFIVGDERLSQFETNENLESNENLEPNLEKDFEKRRKSRFWTADEDALLLEKRAEFTDENINWRLVASNLPGRSGKQCRERFVNCLDPTLKRGSWTKNEEAILVSLQNIHGNRWALISNQLSRSDNDVKNRWHSIQRSKERKERKSRLALSDITPGSGAAPSEPQPTKKRRATDSELRKVSFGPLPNEPQPTKKRRPTESDMRKGSFGASADTGTDSSSSDQVPFEAPVYSPVARANAAEIHETDANHTVPNETRTNHLRLDDNADDESSVDSTTPVETIDLRMAKFPVGSLERGCNIMLRIDTLTFLTVRVEHVERIV